MIPLIVLIKSLLCRFYFLAFSTLLIVNVSVLRSPPQKGIWNLDETAWLNKDK